MTTAKTTTQAAPQFDAIEVAKHLENLMLSCAISEALRAEFSILLTKSAAGHWVATYRSVDKLASIDLPYRNTAEPRIVAEYIHERFPTASIIARI